MEWAYRSLLVRLATFILLSTIILPQIAHSQNFEIIFDLISPTSVNTPESAVATAMADFCPRLQGQNLDQNGQQLAAVCQAVENATPAENAEAFRQLSARSATTETTLVTRIPSAQGLRDIGARLAALRRGAKGFTLSGLTINTGNGLVTPVTGGSAGDELGGLFSNKLSGFMTGTFVISDHDENETDAGFDGDTKGVTVGLDYRYRPTTFFGTAVSLGKGDYDIDRNAGGLDSDNYNVLFYGTHYFKQDWFLEGTLGYGKGDFDLKRRLNFTVSGLSITETAKSSTDGDQYSLGFGGGYHYQFKNGLNALLLASLRYRKDDIDGFNEKDAGGLNLAIDDQSIDSITSSVGGQLKYPVSTRWGVVFPFVSSAWLHEFDDDGSNIKARYISDPFATPFAFTTVDRESDYLRVALGVSAVWPRGVSGFFRYGTVLGLDDDKEHLFSLGMRKEF